MMKRVSIGVLLLISASALVSSHSNVRVENDSGFKKYEGPVVAPAIAVQDFSVNRYDVALNDALVPVVPTSPTVHDSYTRYVADGHTPIPLAMVRGPTEVKNNLTPRIRNQPAC
jgi:hypothetical protein